MTLFKNKYCEIVDSNQEELSIYYLTKRRPHWKCLKKFKVTDVKTYYSVKMRYAPEIKWYIMIPLLLLLFMGSIWIGVHLNKIIYSPQLKEFSDNVSLVTALVSCLMLVIYLIMDLSAGVSVVGRLFGLVVRANHYWYILELKETDNTVEIPLRNKAEVDLLLTSLKL